MKLNILFISSLAFLALAAGNVPNSTDTTTHPVAVIELFTSQGCSSCPPADRLLMETATKAAAANQPVYALSFHVDYWDRLGWRDPFSDARFTARQRHYAQQLGLKTVYTPQAILNGKQEFVGSNRDQLTSLLAVALKQPTPVRIRVTTAQKGQSVVVDTKLSGTLAGAVLNVALVSNLVRTAVNRGENTGKILTHANVVRSFVTVRATESGRVRLPMPANFDPASAAVITYLQNEKTLAVLGAERTPLSL
ncbi:DUF1223 domain-containing protein [Fibrella forsythiae]|uniref:DUF1223 domain-containing protein n=1 Tax=Fibrella forsythiae TaxID=2817061 RepID=A0ABS3JEU1_9BACT|nr:DUF1223 domain-containing protein [Fibrella forsythiae]MBO0948529.1 DUF1223 domain-containing protein [Fibrella forsythiae]